MRKLFSLLFVSIFLLVQPGFGRGVDAASKVVGTGTPESCTEAALVNALKSPGYITFNCGSGTKTILINNQITLIGDYTIDGGGKIILDGQGITRIFLARGYGDTSVSIITLQNMTLQNGYVDWINDGDRQYNGRGAALEALMYTKSYIDNVKFINNQSMSDDEACAGGGAIWSAEYSTLRISNSEFKNNFARNGGAINMLFTDMSIYNTTFENNQAIHTAHINDPSVDPDGCGGGGAIYIDGARSTANGGTGTISISKSVFKNNTTNQHGGAIVSFLYGNDKMEISNSKFDGNSAVFFSSEKSDMTGGTGGAVWHGGSPNYTGKLFVSNSTFTNNHADYIAGGLWAFTPIALTNVTIANNSAYNNRGYVDSPNDPNEGIYKNGLGGGFVTGDGSSLTNVTIANNEAWYTGGGVSIIGVNTSKTTTMVNTIIANNTLRTTGNKEYRRNCNISMVDQGGNFQYPGKTSAATDLNCSTSISIQDPKLESVADNGGPLPTVALRSGSPAIDAAVQSACPDRDQRGYLRSGACDSGSYEYDGHPFVPSDWIYLPAVTR
jgi:hypothetical protein